MSNVGDNKVGSKTTGVKLSDIQKNSEITAQSTSLNAFSKFEASTGARFPTVPSPLDLAHSSSDYNITHFRDHESYDEQGGKRVTYFTDKQCQVGTAKFDHRLETDYTFDQWGIDVKVEISFENTFVSDKSQPNLHIYLKSLVGDVNLWARNSEWDSATEPYVNDDFFNIHLVKPIVNLYDDNDTSLPTTDPQNRGEFFYSVDNGDGSYTFTAAGLAIPSHGEFSQDGSPSTGEVARIELPANGDWYKIRTLQLPFSDQTLKYDVDNAEAPRQDRVEYPLHPEDGDSNDIQIALSYIDKIEVKPAISDNYDYEKLSMERFADAGKKQGYVRKVFEWNKDANFYGGTTKLQINQQGLDYSGDPGYTTACFVLTVPSNNSSTTSQWVDDFVTTYGYPEVNGFELTNTNHVYSEDRGDGTGCVMIFWGHVPDDKLLNDGTKGTFTFGDAYEALPQPSIDVGQDGGGSFWYPTNGTTAAADFELRYMYQASLYFMVGVGRSSSDFVHTYYLDEDNHPWNTFDTGYKQAALDLDAAESCPTEMWKVLSLDDELSKGAYCTIGGGAGETAVDVSTMNRFSWNQLWWNLDYSYYPPSNGGANYPPIIPAHYHTSFSTSCNISIQNGIEYAPTHDPITELGYKNSNPEPEMSFMAVPREDVMEMYDGSYSGTGDNSFGKFWTNWLKPNPGLPISAKNTGGNEYLDSIGIGGDTDRTDQEISYDLDNGNISVTNADAKLHFYRDNMFFEVYDYIPNTEDYYKGYFEESPNLKLEITGIPYTTNGAIVFIDSEIWGWDIDDPRSLATRTLVRKDGSATITVNDYPILTSGFLEFQIKIANHNPDDLSEIITETIPAGNCTSYSGATLTIASNNTRIFPDGYEPNHEIPWGACPNPSLFDKSEIYNTPWHGSYLALNPNPMTNHYYRGGSFDDYLSSKSIGCDAYSIFDADYPSRYRTMSIYGNVLNLVSFRWDTSKYRPPNYPITKRTISTRDFSSTSEGEEKEDRMHPNFGLGRGRSANTRPQCIKFTESLQIKNAYNANVTGSTTWAGHIDKLDNSTFSHINNGYSFRIPDVFDEPYSDRVRYSSPMSEPRTNLSPGAYHRARAERDIPVSAETEFYAPHGMSMMSLPFFDGYSDSTDFGSGLGRFDGNYTKFERPDDPDERSFVFEFDDTVGGSAFTDGQFRSINNNLNKSASTQLHFSVNDINSNAVSSYIQSLFDVEEPIKGTLTVTNNADAPDDFITYNITSGQFSAGDYVILNVTRTTNYSDLHDNTWNDGENYTFAFNRAQPSIEADGNDDYIDLGFTFRIVCVDHDVADNNCPIYEVYMSSASSIQNFKHGGGHCKTVINELPEVTDYPLKGVEAPLDSRGKRIERLVSRFKPSQDRHPEDSTVYDQVDPSEQDWEMFSIMLGLHTEYPRNEILFDRWVADQSDAGNNTLMNPIFIGLDNDRAIDHYNENNGRFVGSAPDHSEYTVDTGIISKFHGTPTDTDVQLILEDYPDTDPTYSQAYHNSYYNSRADGDAEPLWENPIEDPADREPVADALISSPSSSDPYPTKDPRKYGIFAEAVYSDDTDNPANIGIRFRTNDGEAKSINFGPELYAENFFAGIPPFAQTFARNYADIHFSTTPIEGETHTPSEIRVTIPEQNIVGEGYYSINIPETGFSEVYWADSGEYSASVDGHSGTNETILSDYRIHNPDSITSSIQGKTALMQYTDTYPWDNVADDITEFYTDFKEIHGFKSLREGYTDIAGSHFGATQSPTDPSNDWWNFGPVLDDYIQYSKAYPGTASLEVGGLQQEVHLTSLGVSTDVTSPLGNPEVMGDSDDISVPQGTSSYYPQNQDKNAGYGLIRIGNKIGASVGLKVVNRFHKKDLTDPTGSWGYDRSHRVGDDPEKNRKLYERVQSLKIYGTQPLPKDEELNEISERIRTFDLGSKESIDLVDEIMFRTKFEGMVTYPREAEFNLAFIDRTANVSGTSSSGNPYYMEHANTNDVLTGLSTTDASVDRDGYVYGKIMHNISADTSLVSGFSAGQWQDTIIKLKVGDKLVINRSSATLPAGEVHIDEEFLIRKTNLDSSLGSSAAAKANWQVINSAYTGIQVGDHEYVDDGQEYIWTDLRSILDSDGLEQLSIYNGHMIRPLDENGDLTTDHGFSTGQPVIVTLTGSFGPFVSGRTYYVQSLDDNYFQLYDTKANAETGGFTGRVKWSQADEDNATGDLTITPDNSLQIIQTVDPDTGAPSFVHGAHSTLEWYTDQAEPGIYAVTLGVDNDTNAATYPRVYALIDLRSNCFNDDKLIINAPFGHIPLSTDTSTTTENLNGLHWWAANESTSNGDTYDNVLLPLPGISTIDETFSDRDGMPYGYSATDESYVHLKRGDVITFDYKGSTGTVDSDKPYGFRIKYESSNGTTAPSPASITRPVTIGVENSIFPNPVQGYTDPGTLIWDTTYSPAGLYYLAQQEHTGKGENVPDNNGQSTDHKTYFKIIVSEY